ncbi:hypothetical protein LZK77_16275 [Rhizobium leguminosarum]|nr:hypothetical protein LZK77_16275 [Rhizobium leguminosarum]
MSDEIKKLLAAQRSFQSGFATDALRDAALKLTSAPVAMELARSMERLKAPSPVLDAAMGRLNGSSLVDDAVLGRMRSLTETIAGSAEPQWQKDLARLSFRLPEAHGLSSFTRQLTLPVGSQFPDITARYSQFGEAMRTALGSFDLLRERMSSMKTPWVDLERSGLSGKAFLNLQAVGALSLSQNPFGSAVSSALRAQLGDWRDPISFDSEALQSPAERFGLYRDRGYSADLEVLDAPAYEETVEIAGLVYDQGADAVPDDADELELNFQAYQSLVRFERNVRAFIVKVMTEACGANWVRQRIPGDLREKWEAKKVAAQSNGETDLPLIDYADFADYKVIIERSDNWKEVFQAIFGRKDDVRESFQRLQPVRIATMHSRLITLDDDLFLRAETTRIMRKIRPHL